MSMLTKPSFGPTAALGYITVGALLCVWTSVYYLVSMPRGDSEATRSTLFWLTGFFLTGLTLTIIGLALGRIGRAARESELPPPEVTPQAAQAEINATQVPPVVPTAAIAPAAVAPAAAPPSHAAAPVEVRRPPVGSRGA